MIERFAPLGATDPQQVAGYVLHARLGSGGMANVYLVLPGIPLHVDKRVEFAPGIRRLWQALIASHDCRLGLIGTLMSQRKAESRVAPARERASPIRPGGGYRNASTKNRLNKPAARQ
jgi:hypothetical protein